MPVGIGRSECGKLRRESRGFKWVADEQNWAWVFKPDGIQFAGTEGDALAEYRTGHCWKRHIDWSPDGRYIPIGRELAGAILLFTLSS